MAHEINNPLGGLFNAIDTLKKHGDKQMVRASSLSLIERGLFGIRDVVQAALTTYRAKDGGRSLTLKDFDDVRLLLGPELRRRGQSLEWTVDAEPLPLLPSSIVRQTVLNLLLNASAAGGTGGRLSFRATARDGGLTIAVGDSGPGLGEQGAAILTGTRMELLVGSGKGLGLWMVRRFVDEAGGSVTIGASPLGGAEVQLYFPAIAREAQPDAA
jgi:signal transduction histidine kinase